jgi:PhnB protein
MAVSPIPPGFRSVTPHLCIRGAGEALAFYKKAFGAVEIMRMPTPNGMIGHAEIKIGDSIIMLADEFPGAPLASPAKLGGCCSSVMLYVPDCDALYKQAVAAGAKPTMPLMDMFWGDRFGQVTDPYGHVWAIATHKEDVPPEEMGKRAAEAMKNMGGK